MIYNELFSADNRINKKNREEANKVDIGTLEFNHKNPTFDYTLKVMKELNKLFA